MRFLINGVEGNSLTHIRGSDSVFNVLFLSDTGTPLSLASPALATLEFFTSATRSDTPAATLSVTPGAGAAAGYGTALIQDTNLDLSRGTTYVWGRYKSDSGTGVGTTVVVGVSPAKLEVV